MKNELLTIGPVTIHGYGLMIGIGILVCIYMGMLRARRNGLKEEAVLDIALIGLAAGFLGAKLLFLIVEWETFLKDPMRVIGSEGFVVYGGIIGGVLSAIVYCRIKKLNFLSYFDLCAPSIAVAQGFGRIGCLLAGCCYGRPTESPIGIQFPEGSLAPAGVSLLPTQIISSAGNFIIMFILLWYYKRSRHTGYTGFLYMLLYGVGRFCIEFLRNDDRGGVGSLSTSQFISVFIVAGALLLFYLNRKNEKTGAKAEERKKEQDA